MIHNKKSIQSQAFRRNFSNKRKATILMVVLGLFVFSASPALAETYYLDAVNGNDDNPGSSQSPWRTIEKAISTAIWGDTVIMRNGDYGALDLHTEGKLPPPYDGDITQLLGDVDRLVFQADTGHTPTFSRETIDGQQLSVWIGDIDGGNSLATYTFSGITFDGGVCLQKCIGLRIRDSNLYDTRAIGNAGGGIGLDNCGDIVLALKWTGKFLLLKMSQNTRYTSATGNQ